MGLKVVEVRGKIYPASKMIVESEGFVLSRHFIKRKARLSDGSQIVFCKSVPIEHRK